MKLWLIFSIGIQIFIYLLPSISLPKGKWIRHTATVPMGLSGSVELKPYGQSRSNSKEIKQ